MLRFTAKDAREMTNNALGNEGLQQEIRERVDARVENLPKLIEDSWIPQIREAANEGLCAFVFSVSSFQESKEATKILEDKGYKVLGVCFRLSENDGKPCHKLAVCW